MDSAERGMTIINFWKEYWLSLGSNQRPPVLKSATLSTELWGSWINLSNDLILDSIILKAFADDTRNASQMF